MLSAVICGLPICLPFALAFAIPERTRVRILFFHRLFRDGILSLTESSCTPCNTAFPGRCPWRRSSWEARPLPGWRGTGRPWRWGAAESRSRRRRSQAEKGPCFRGCNQCRNPGALSGKHPGRAAAPQQADGPRRR